jgi:hypothetical protein
MFQLGLSDSQEKNETDSHEKMRHAKISSRAMFVSSHNLSSVAIVLSRKIAQAGFDF